MKKIVKKVLSYKPLRPLYRHARNTYRFFKSFKKQSKFNNKYKLENRSKNSKYLVMVLAGYKSYCYDLAFKRIRMFTPKNFDVCIISSGLYSKELSDIAKNNEWSYVSYRRNNISAAINSTIKLFKKAFYIFKIDEDIFITKNFYNSILKMQAFSSQDDFIYNQPSFFAPLINLNGFSTYYFLKEMNLLDKYIERFRLIKITANDFCEIENNSNISKFLWGENDIVPHIDIADDYLNKQKFNYSICPIKFSIGAIMFTRKCWKDMNYFDPGIGIGLGADENYLCNYAMINSRPIMVSLNCCVGHLAFGPQNAVMKQYLRNNKEKFDVKTN